MNLFQIVRTSITVKQAAALYGLSTTLTGMACCPFHEDRHPSMKLNDTYYYCFGCGATGDVIDLTARLFDLSSLQAARKLAADFGLDPNRPPAGSVILPRRPAKPTDQELEDIAYCTRVLHDYRDLLARWQAECSPRSPEEPLDERFVEALQMFDLVDQLIDHLSYGPAEKKARAAKQLLSGQLLPQFEARLDKPKTKEAA